MAIPFHITWEAPEFEYHERHVAWYWTSMIIAALLIAFAVWERNFLFGVFIIIAEILIIVWANKLPRTFTVTVTEKNIMIGPRTHYLLSEIEAFSINEFPESDAGDIIFHLKAKIRPSVIVAIPQEIIEEIRKHLKGIMKETSYEPTFIDTLERLVGF